MDERILELANEILYEEKWKGNSNPVLKSLYQVLGSMEHVKINFDAVESVAKSDEIPLQLPTWKSPPPWFGCFIDEDSSDTIQYFMLGNAINFKFWYDDKPTDRFEVMYKGQKEHGAFAMWACLKMAHEEGKYEILDADFLSEVDEKTVDNIFCGERSIPMLKERTKIFNEVGQNLKLHYGGHFENVLKASNRKAFDNGSGFVDRVVRDFPSFKDVGIYEKTGGRVKFYKRAQLGTGMLYARLKGTGLFEIDDTDSLTVYADYELPRGLKKLGVFEYSKELEGKIRNMELIPKGSVYEHELRAATIWASKLLEERSRWYGKKVNALNVDYYLWKSARDYTDLPHHLTVTTDY